MSAGYLLDTHTFLWAATSPEKLSRKAKRACEQLTVPLVLSVVSIWEVAVKTSIGKLCIPDPLTTVPDWVQRMNLQVLPFDPAHAYAVYSLPMLHRDPFDRMLIAQANAEDLMLVTADENIHRYDVKWIW